ncbi:MAG: MDR family MFS transporter [Nitrososphaerales archaeon]
MTESHSTTNSAPAAGASPDRSGAGSALAPTQTIPRRNFILIIAGLMTGLLLGAMDQTIVATAGPTIISDLGGLNLYAWVFSAYILAQTVAMPIFGKLSDLYGRRRFFVLGLVIFMAGSIASGAAQNIDELIVSRAVQGMGGGAFFPIALSIAGVTFPPEQRGRITGIFSSVFGIASVLGPSVGTYIVDVVNWRWVFYINLPLGIASIILLFAGLSESKSLIKPKLDWLGIPTLAGWIALLDLGFLNGGSTYPWLSWEEAAFFAGSATLFAIFIQIERTSAEPVLPLSLFKVRNISASSGVSFLRGLMLLAVVSYIPLFVQAGLGHSINTSSEILDAFLLPMIVASVIGGSLVTRLSYRALTVTGMVIATLGAYTLTFVGAGVGTAQLAESCAIMGFGVGMTFSSTFLSIQNSAPRKQIGIASSLPQFMGNLGGTIGLAILGTIQVNTFASKVSGVLTAVPPQYQQLASQYLGNANQAGQILASPQVLQQLLAQYPALAPLIPQLRDAFVLSITPLFTAGVIIGAVAVCAGLLLQGSMKQQLLSRQAASAAKKEPEEIPAAAPM